MKLKITEAQIQHAVLEYLKLLERLGRVYFVRNNSIAGKIVRSNGSIGWIQNAKKGTPDIVCCCDGRFVGIEIKSEKGKLSPEQEEAKELILKCGGEYIVIRSAGELEDYFGNRNA